jgi:hypothetical protein
MRQIFERQNALVTLLTALLITPLVSAQPVNIDATDHGWYNSKGEHTPTNVNYYAGDTLSGRDVHNFFVFDLSGVTQQITAAKLALTLPSAGGYNSQDPSETFELHDVTSSISNLVAGTGGVDAYSDLGAGTVYGSRTITPADSGSVVEITLNSSAVAALDAAPGLFALGGSLTSLDPATNHEFIFGNTHLGVVVTQLRLTLGHSPPGNFNDDKAVDAADYVLWRKTDNSTSGYTSWRANFGTVVATGAAAIPEPGTLSLLPLGTICLFYKRKQKLRTAPTS